MGTYHLKHEDNEGKGKRATTGKGWGDGQKAAAFHQSRRKHITERMSTSEFTTFRPRVDNEGDYWIIRDWGAEDVRQLQIDAGYKPTGISLSALFNCLLKGLATSVQNTTQIDTDGNISIELNLGRINIK